MCRVLETRQGCGLVIYSRTFLIHSRPHLLWTLTEGKGRYPRALDLALRTSPDAGEQKVKGGSLQSTSGGAAGSVVEAPTRHNEKPHHENTIARPHQH